MTAALVAPTVGLRIPAGARWRHTFTAPLNDAGQALDVTGWVGRGEIKPRPESGTVYYTWLASQIVCDATTVTVIVPASVSRLWTWTAGVYMIELDNPAQVGEPYRLASGPVVVDPWPVPGAPEPVEGLTYPSPSLYPSAALYPQGV